MIIKNTLYLCDLFQERVCRLLSASKVYVDERNIVVNL